MDKAVCVFKNIPVKDPLLYGVKSLHCKAQRFQTVTGRYFSTFGKGVQQPTRTRPRHRLHRSRRCRPPDPPPPSSSSPLLSPPPSPRSSLHDEKGTSQANSSQFPPQDARSVHWVVARLWVAMAVALSHKRQLMAATYQGLPARCLCLADARPPCLASSHVSVTRATATAESCPKVPFPKRADLL